MTQKVPKKPKLCVVCGESFMPKYHRQSTCRNPDRNCKLAYAAFYRKQQLKSRDKVVEIPLELLSFYSKYPTTTTEIMNNELVPNLGLSRTLPSRPADHDLFNAYLSKSL